MVLGKYLSNLFRKAFFTMITFVDIDKDNWNVWGGLVERSEIIFPDQLRSCSAEYSEILRMKRSIAKIAMLGSEYIGNIIGCRMSAKDLDEGHTEDLDKSIMLCNFVIDPKHHGRGYGSVMLIDFIRSAMQAG
ncbi:MAG: GNAT family N-acetyltransferase, partial [Nanoarchaeota archaeon]|nr:GNAT family N-acetyltransferase [Nanoarchaeota archaeon]